MKYILLAMAMLTSISVFSQEKYDLFIIEDKLSRGFTENHNLDRIKQIYYLDSDSNCLIFYNHYLRFDISQDSVKVSFLGVDEGTYKNKVFKTDSQWYILEFIVNERPVYYYFYRRYDFLDKVWID